MMASFTGRFVLRQHVPWGFYLGHRRNADYIPHLPSDRDATKAFYPSQPNAVGAPDDAEGPPLTPRCPKLLAVLPHDRCGRFKPDADTAALVEISALGGNSTDDILGGQYRCHLADHLDR